MTLTKYPLVEPGRIGGGRGGGGKGDGGGDGRGDGGREGGGGRGGGDGGVGGGFGTGKNGGGGGDGGGGEGGGGEGAGTSSDDMVGCDTLSTTMPAFEKTSPQPPDAMVLTMSTVAEVAALADTKMSFVSTNTDPAACGECSRAAEVARV